MKYIFLFLVSVNLYAQNKDVFDVEYVHLDERPTETIFANTFPISNKYFFEDEDYIVIKSCRGEFGGNIIFKSKKDSSEYVCAATCPIVINKINGKYYLTTTLLHMSGSCGLFEIENPKELSIISPDDEDNESYNKTKSLVGVKTLLNLSNKTILISFLHQNKLYHIVNEGLKIYIAERQNSELKVIQNLKDIGMIYPGSETFSVSDKQKVATFRTNEIAGYFDIFENVVRIYTYK